MKRIAFVDARPMGMFSVEIRGTIFVEISVTRIAFVETRRTVGWVSVRLLTFCFQCTQVTTDKKIEGFAGKLSYGLPQAHMSWSRSVLSYKTVIFWGYVHTSRALEQNWRYRDVTEIPRRCLSIRHNHLIVAIRFRIDPQNNCHMGPNNLGFTMIVL